MYSHFVLIFPFPFSGTGECTHARVVSFTCFATQGPTRANKLRIFMIKLSHSSSTYENTFPFQHFSDRRRVSSVPLFNYCTGIYILYKHFYSLQIVFNRKN